MTNTIIVAVVVCDTAKEHPMNDLNRTVEKGEVFSVLEYSCDINPATEILLLEGNHYRRFPRSNVDIRYVEYECAELD